MGWAALIMGGSILLSRFMGLFRDKAISFLFGATQESDLYFAAFVIPDFINYLLAGAYFSVTLIPLLSVYFDRDEEDGWRFFSTVFTWIAIFITVLTVLSMIFASQLAHMAAPGLGAASLRRLTFFLRIIMPAQICFLLGSCFTAILYLRKQFVIPALSPLVYNLLIILGGILLYKRGMEGFCWGVLAGALVGNLLLPYFAVRRGGDVKLYFSTYHPALKKFVLLALPLMLGQSIVAIDEQLIRIFGSLAGTGAISWLSYARRIMLVPVGVVAQAASVASYPFLAELVARQDFSRFHRTINSALRSVITLLIPLSVWMIAVSEPTIRIIFQQGHFGPTDTLQTTHLLRILLVVVFCWGFQQVLGRAYYARQDTITPAVIGTLCSLISIPVFFLLTKQIQATGVAMASAISVSLYTGVLTIWWIHRFGKEAFSGLAADLFKLIAISVAAWAPTALLVRFIFSDMSRHIYLSALCSIGAGGLCFFPLFVLMSRFFIPALIKPFLQRLGPLGRWLNRETPPGVRLS
jgi:putative peptidoglycan lipid II flippase